MNVDYHEFLRIMTWILIVLLVIQGLDYIVGFGVNNYLFIVFCITFAFTMGTIYYNILEERKAKEQENDEKNAEEKIQEQLNEIQENIDREFKEKGLTDELLEAQVKLNEVRNELDLADKNNVNDEGFVQ